VYASFFSSSVRKLAVYAFFGRYQNAKKETAKVSVLDRDVEVVGILTTHCQAPLNNEEVTPRIQPGLDLKHPKGK
jgi:hypothetical protein